MAQLMAFERLEEITGHDDELTNEVIRLFLDTTKVYLERLVTALKSDHSDWSGGAHALKGCCANFGADALADLAKLCESEEPSQERIDELYGMFAATESLLTVRLTRNEAVSIPS